MLVFLKTYDRNMRYELIIIYIHVNVHFGHQLVLDEDKQPFYLSTRVGESALFICDLDFPQDVITPYILNWNKEGERVASIQDGSMIYAHNGYKGRISVSSFHDRSELNLTTVREPDRGWYECRLFFPNRNPPFRLNGTWFHLTVHGSDLLGHPPLNNTAIEGQDVTLECESKDESARVTWYKDGVQMSSVLGLSGRSWVSPKGSLTITQVQPEDLGQYKCEVVAQTGESQAATAFLNVQYKARVLYTPREVFLPIGRSGSFDCLYSANPPLTKLRWEKDGFLFDAFNVPGALSRRNGSLYFNKVEESHGGKYTCTPNNALGTTGPSPPIHVVVQHPPVFTVTPHNMYLKKPGDTIHMLCDALDGEIRPTIVWFRKDGSTLPRERAVISGGNLTIKDIQESDRGTYQCVASNEAATISADTELFIENDIPRGPHNLTAESGPTSVSLWWLPGITNGAQASVLIRRVDSQQWKTINVSGTQATIRALQPSKNYEFMVFNHDETGGIYGGMFSNLVRVKTKDLNGTSNEVNSEHSALAISPPSGARITTTNDGYVLEWEHPSSGADSVHHYSVHWKQTSPTENNDHYAEISEETSYLVGKLDVDKVYEFQIKAISKNGKESETIHFILHIPPYQLSQMPWHLAGLLIALVLCGLCGCIVIFRKRLQKRLLKSDRS